MANWRPIPEGQMFAGLNDVMGKLQAVVDGVEEQSAEGLKKAASAVMSEARERAPLDTGDLRRSGTITDPVIEGDAVSVEFGFYAPYAATQHEHSEFVHPLGGESKYLENAIINNQDQILRLIAGGLFK